MRKRRLLNTVIAWWATAAMLVVSFHAHEHLHSAANSGTGHIVKHWHFDHGHSESAGPTFEAEQHVPDGELGISFQSSKIFAFPPPVLLTALLDNPPDESRFDPIPSDILPITYDPPRQTGPSRAPPLPTLL